MSIAEKLSTISTCLTEMNNGINTEAALIAELQGIVDNIPASSNGSYDEGFADGQQAEHDSFWNSFFRLENKDYTSFSYLFAGCGWDDTTFNPPRGTVISAENRSSKSAAGMFMSCRITDLKGICESLGVTIDFSHVTSFSQFIADSTIATLPTINSRSASNLNNLFFAPQKLHTVEKVILKDDGSQTFNANSFYLCGKLENIVFEGAFGTSVNFSGAPVLSEQSVQSIIDHLKDLTGAAAQTLTFHADVGGKLTEAQKATITAKNWTLVY